MIAPVTHVPAPARPLPQDRAFRSAAVEARLRVAGARVADPELRRLLEMTLPNTLDTTVRAGGSDGSPDTFVVTGDIDAMWLRDSTAQVWPYLRSAPDDAALDRLLRGVIARQTACVLLDPYANAFMASPADVGPWADDDTEMRPGVHERKWEPDSLAAFLRLSAGYAAATSSVAPFGAEWRGALERVLTTLRVEQRIGGPSPYRFRRLTGNPLDNMPLDGHGAPSRPNGMVHGAFRPSDDACALPFNVPVNLTLAAALDAVAPMAAEAGAPGSANLARSLAAFIRAGVARDGVVDGRWAYEVDGLGGVVEMDDANAPSLLSLPYLGACAAGSPLYSATRRQVLSAANPWFFSGRVGDGVGSPHTGRGQIWPIAVAMRGLTAIDDAERLTCIRLLAASHAGTYLAHESFSVDNPAVFTRPWFAWANSLAGELLEGAALAGLLA